MKKWGKRLLICLILMIVFVGFATLIINYHVIKSTEDRIISAEEASQLNTDAIIVLGAGVRPDRTPSPMLEDRLIQGVELYLLGSSEKILMSGDNSTTHYDEVTVMKKYARTLGVPSKDIFKDHAGFNTYNSMFRAQAIFEVNTTLIVTQKYHLYRSLYIAEKLGLDAYGVASDPRVYAGQEARDFREVLARVKDFFLAIFKPDPVYLGDKIPITGNGDSY